MGGTEMLAYSCTLNNFSFLTTHDRIMDVIDALGIIMAFLWEYA